MKRTWITIKRGILEPKHRFALGELIWLYIYILDLTNWEEGIIEEWLDRGAAEEMEMPYSTLVDQRRKLEQKGYITCQRKQHGIRVVVHNWTNPREYTGKKYNEKVLVNTPINTLVNTPINTVSVQKNIPSIISKVTNQKLNTIPSPNGESEEFVGRTDAIKKGDVVDMQILSLSKPSNPFDKYPEDVKPLCQAFLKYSGINPIPNQKSYWIKGCRHLLEVGIKPDDIPVLILRMGKLTYTSPESLVKIAQVYKAIPQDNEDRRPKARI